MQIRHLGFGAAIMALMAQPAAAAASTEICFTRDETRMALSYLTPLLVEGLVTSCTPYMASESPLLKLGPAMAANYRAVANPTDADIAALFSKFGGAMGDAPPGLTLDIIKTQLVTEMAKGIKAEDCVMANKFAADLAALPAANMLGLVETGLVLAELKDRQKKAKRTKKPIAPSIFCDGQG